MEMIEAGQLAMVDAGVEDQKMVFPVGAQAMEVVAEQPRGVKRRRDRGSTAKERISKMPPCAAGKRSSIYRGVTRHRWTGRYEAHLWDKSTWNQTQNKKGKQVYLGAYDEEEAAARAYDLAALKYWGPGTLINFPVTDYSRDIDEMKNVTREEYLASLRRKSSGFSRGVSKYRGVARHHHNGRWEARIGRVFGNKYLYLGTYSTQEEAAAAYDMAAIEYRGLNAVTNFDLSRYIRWLRPGQGNKPQSEAEANQSPNNGVGGEESQLTGLSDENLGSQEELNTQNPVWPAQSTEPYQLPALGLAPSAPQQRSPTALSILQQSSMFKQMMERASAAEATECDSMSTGPSEISQEIEQQQQNCNQQHQDSNSFFASWGKQTNYQQHDAARCLVEDESSARQDCLSHDNSASFQQSVSSNYQQHPVTPNYQQSVTSNYQQSVTSNYQQLDMTSNYQQAVTSSYQQSVPSSYEQSVPSSYEQSVPSSYEQSVPSGYEQSVPSSYEQSVPSNYEQSMASSYEQSMPSSYHHTSNYHDVVGDHYSELQDRKPQHFSDNLAAAYGQGYSHNLLSSLYSTPQNSGLSASLDDGLPSWAFTNALPLSSTLPLPNAISTC